MSSDTSLTLRIPEKLKDSIKEYAERRGTNVTQLTLDHYRYLLEQEHQQEAEQI
jgi:predicted DNA binding CopG/RHH family protein